MNKGIKAAFCLPSIWSREFQDTRLACAAIKPPCCLYPVRGMSKLTKLPTRCTQRWPWFAQARRWD